MTDDQRTIAAMNSDRRAFRSTARIGLIAAPAMFILPLIWPLTTGGWYAPAVVSMTAAWAVLVSACSFAAMAHTRPGGHPWVHQVWAVPVAVLAMVPGGLAAVLLYALVASAVH